MWQHYQTHENVMHQMGVVTLGLQPMPRTWQYINQAWQNCFQNTTTLKMTSKMPLVLHYLLKQSESSFMMLAWMLEDQPCASLCTNITSGIIWSRLMTKWDGSFRIRHGHYSLVSPDSVLISHTVEEGEMCNLHLSV